MISNMSAIRRPGCVIEFRHWPMRTGGHGRYNLVSMPRVGRRRSLRLALFMGIVATLLLLFVFAFSWMRPLMSRR